MGRQRSGKSAELQKDYGEINHRTRLFEAIKQLKNSYEELLDKNGAKKTSHTTNKVPCIIYDNTVNKVKYQLAPVYNPGLANIAATMAVLLGQNDYPESWDASLIEIK